MVPIGNPEPYLAVERCLDVPARYLIVGRAVNADPSLNGARLADILEMYDNNDAFLEFTENLEMADLCSEEEWPFIRAAAMAVCLMADDPDPQSSFMQNVAPTLVRLLVAAALRKAGDMRWSAN